MSKYRKKPIIIEAMQYTGNNSDELIKFGNGHVEAQNGVVTISTLEGVVRARINDYIIKGIAGEFYPCAEDVFERTYDLVDNS